MCVEDQLTVHIFRKHSCSLELNGTVGLQWRGYRLLGKPQSAAISGCISEENVCFLKLPVSSELLTKGLAKLYLKYTSLE